MPVSVPDVPGDDPRQRSVVPTGDRLARTVATLFGVPWAGNPAGRCWVRQYDDVSLREVGVGRPNDADSGGNVDDLSSATLNRYRPDRKAGVVLAGCDVLFGSVSDLFEQVIQTIGYTDRNDALSPEIRLAIWAVLVQEAYRSQPALFVAAVTARRIQRALTTGWTLVRGIGDLEEVLAPVVERSLGILDDTILEMKDLFVEWSDPDANIELLGENLVERWVDHLLGDAAAGVAWVVVDGEDNEIAVPFVSSLTALNAFISEVWPSGHEASDERLLPRIPTGGELRRLRPDAQRLCVYSAMQIHRLIRDNPRYHRQDVEFQRRVTDEAYRLYQCADDVLGSEDPLTRIANARWLNKRVIDLRERAPADAEPAVLELRSAVDGINAAYLQGQIDRGTYVDQVRGLSSVFSSITGDAVARGNQDLARYLLEGSLIDWGHIVDALGLNIDGGIQNVESLEPDWMRRFKGQLHNYAAVLVNSTEVSDIDRAVAMLRDVVVPERRRWFASDNRPTPLRLSLQLMIRAIDSRISKKPEPTARGLAELAAGTAAELLSLPNVAQVVAVGPQRSGEINILTSVLIGAALALEYDLRIAEFENLDLPALANHAVHVLTERSGSGRSGRSGRLVQAIGLARRIDKVAS